MADEGTIKPDVNRVVTAPKAPAPFSNYAVAVESAPNARLLHVSGQVGVRPDGSLPADPQDQHAQAWANVFAVLEAAGMEPTDIVDVLAIVSTPAGVPVFRPVRDRMLGGHLACSTLLVCGLASPDWQVEIAVKAAR